MAEGIKAGDVVRLKSGGPDMTVQDTGDYLMSGGTGNDAKCVWFDGKKRMIDIFAIEGLEKPPATAPHTSVPFVVR
jgi:uncharacterized protein YodC (DUF2158 family)